MEDAKKNQSKILEMKNVVFLMKNTVDGTHNRLDTPQEKINEPEDIAIETTQKETQRKYKIKIMAYQSVVRWYPMTQYSCDQGLTEEGKKGKIFEEIKARILKM